MAGLPGRLPVFFLLSPSAAVSSTAISFVARSPPVPLPLLAPPPPFQSSPPPFQSSPPPFQSSRSFSLSHRSLGRSLRATFWPSATDEIVKRRWGCSKWKRGGLIETDIYTGMKGQPPVPKPLPDFKSGDRNVEYDQVSPHTPRADFRDVDMSALDPMVRRILSAEFTDPWDLVRYHQGSILDKLRRYPGDESSLEVKIALETFTWKSLHAAFKHNKSSRKKLKPVLVFLERERYEKLMRLRLSDYDRFVYVCDVLGIDFKPKPDVDVELTEKQKILLKAQEEADALKEDKIFEYKKFLEKEREKFEVVKRDVVEKLNKDLEQFGFDHHEQQQQQQQQQRQQEQ